jgi:choline/glycine/proline betaine transport protein
MLFICWGLVKALRLDVTKMQALQDARITPRAIKNPRSWQQRLGLIMHYPHTKQEVDRYIEDVVQKAFLSLQKEFNRRDFEISIQEVDGGLALWVNHHDEINFIYQVISRETTTPSFMMESQEEDTQNYQAEVFLREGGQNYDVINWTQEDLIQDIIDQYERHLHFLSLVRTEQP